MQTSFTVSLSTLHEVAQQIITYFPKYNIFTFSGTMGSGKTTLVREICNLLQVKETVTSPTFAIINEYFTPQNQKIAHLDCYRIASIQEMIDIGIEEYFNNHNTIMLIEWPEKIATLLHQESNVVNIDIAIQSENSRKMTINTP